MFRVQMHKLLRGLVVLALAAPAAPAATFTGVVPGAGLIHLQSGSIRGQRFVHLVRQHTDFSCGAAALATILRYAYHRPVTEQQVLQGLYQVSNVALVQQKGFSLMNIKRYVERIGLKGAGFRIPPEALSRIKVPVIVLLNLRGYEHFVVLRRERAGMVYLADPALGKRIVPVAQFKHEWDGIIFAVLGPGYDPHNLLLRPRPPLHVNAAMGQAAWLRGTGMVEFGANTGLF